ncbi:imidazole glycerol phosphate synthase subunit HisH [bacterium]|nr:imidazole glycerol phosphate synthase subunit HisH [bacterium]
MIALIDYGMGNLGSVHKALLKVGCEVEITSDAAVIEAADGVVLPGVGAFDDCMTNLEQAGVIPAIKAAIAADKPFVGICLGLQVLFESSEEGKLPGLGILPGKVVRFRHSLKIPQIGWNQITIHGDVPLLRGVAQGPWTYFVHSYYAEPADDSLIATTTDYGYEFCSAVRRGNLYASQWHPEKSAAVGLQVLANFRKAVQGEL